MRRTISSLAVLIVLLGLSACDSSIPFPEESYDLIPLEVGAKWTLQEIQFIGHSYPPGARTVERIENGRTVTLEVSRDTTIDGERWFAFRGDTTFNVRNLRHDFISMATRYDRTGFWYTNRDDGLYRMRSGESPHLLYSVDAASGDTFVDRTDYAVTRLDSADSYDLESFGEVAAHSYARVPRRYEKDGREGEVATQITLNDYLSPELGFVALDEISYFSEEFEDGKWFPGSVTRWELISYDKP